MNWYDYLLLYLSSVSTLIFLSINYGKINNNEIKLRSVRSVFIIIIFSLLITINTNLNNSYSRAFISYVFIMINYYLFYKYNNYKIFIIFQMILLAAYSIHNFFRNRINICTMCIMVTMKYFIPMSIFIDFFENIIAYFILFLSIPLIRTIEYAGKERY